MKHYLVYLWLRAKDGAFSAGTPYYVGKTVYRKRTFGQPHTVRPPNNKANIRLLDCESEAAAFELEKLLIRIYGRADLGTGCLRNRTEGGEGTVGLIFSPEHRARMSAANKGKVLDAEHRAKMSAAQKNRFTKGKGGILAETRAKMSAARMGMHPTAKSRAKMRAAQVASKSSQKARHVRWHVKRNITNQNCSFCHANVVVNAAAIVPA